MRLSRPCYDKPHRCPGWAGGGWRSASDRHPCSNGTIRTCKHDPDFPGEYLHPGVAKWHFGYCAGSRHTGSEPCGVVTWPWVLRRLDPTWWRGYYGWRIKYWLQDHFGRKS